MSYDFQSCFWDPNDDGVNILLQHIKNGIKSNSNIENFFKLKFELQKDLSRRMGAINDKFDKEISTNADFGKLNDSLQKLLTVEKNIAKAHSKQSEIILQTIYNDVKSYNTQLRARYTTMSGKIENLRLDKFNKKKGCNDLAKRLEDAQTKVRDLTLNANNIIGQRKSEQNSKELAKWENNSNEISMQLNILKKEYKAAQRFWLKEWAELTYQFQEMENSRIAFVQSKLQKYADCVMETSILEQTKFDLFTNDLSMFTPMDDIAKFSSDYGTGRLKDKHQQRIITNTNTTIRTALTSSSSIQTATYSSPTTNIDNVRPTLFNGNGANDNKRNSYMESIRKLSNQLQKTYLNNNANVNSSSQTKQVEPIQTRKMRNSSNKSYRYSLHESNLPSYQDENNSRSVDNYDMEDHKLHTDENLFRKAYTHAGMDNMSNQDHIHTQKSSDEQDLTNQNVKYDNISDSHNIADATSNIQKSHRALNSKTDSEFSGVSSSYNPTDFTTHRRRSIESFSTSVTSMVTSIDDKQRFAKSWNSINRKRKSMSHIPDLLDTSIQSKAKSTDKNDINTRMNSSDSAANARQVSTNTILVKSFKDSTNYMTNSDIMTAGRPRSRRRSMVVGTSNDPIADALYEMEKLQGGISNDAKLGRVRDNGIIVTLPLVTRTGKDVIKYAKALYPLLENTSDEVVRFDKNDYLLITEEVNQDWFMGEVYDNERIDVNHRYGLIPINFIQILE